jgi:hypothetical protein
MQPRDAIVGWAASKQLVAQELLVGGGCSGSRGSGSLARVAAQCVGMSGVLAGLWVAGSGNCW